MTLTDPKLWFDVAQFLITALIGIYVWQANRHRASREQIEKLRKDSDERLDSHGERLTAIEQNQKHQPKAEDLTKLSLNIERINGDVKALTANLEGIKDLGDMLRRQVNRIDDFLKRSSA